MLICCGLYDLLRGILLLLPDLMLEEVMDKLIQPEVLIVLVNHPSPLIQQGVMKVSSGVSVEVQSQSSHSAGPLETGDNTPAITSFTLAHHMLICL